MRTDPPPAPVDAPRAGLGVVLALAAYAAFSFIDAGGKWLSLAGLPAFQLVFMRYAVHLGLSLAILAPRGVSIRGPGTGLLFLRGSLLAGSTIFNFVALGYLPITLTSTIIFLAPIIVCALSWPMLGERVGPFRWTAIMVGFTGVLIAVNPFGESFHPAVLLSLCSVTCFSLYNMAPIFR